MKVKHLKREIISRIFNRSRSSNEKMRLGLSKLKPNLELRTFDSLRQMMILFQKGVEAMKVLEARNLVGESRSAVWCSEETMSRILNGV